MASVLAEALAQLLSVGRKPKVEILTRSCCTTQFRTDAFNNVARLCNTL
jgi:hypothetical protein